MSNPFLVTFPGATTAEGNRLATSLSTAIKQVGREIAVEQKRQNRDSQDQGSILALTLGSAAIGSVAKGIALWIAKNSGTVVKIQTPDGTSVDIRHATGQDTAQIVEAALKRH
jgi:hypothetical protein